MSRAVTATAQYADFHCLLVYAGLIQAPTPHHHPTPLSSSSSSTTYLPRGVHRNI